MEMWLINTYLIIHLMLAGLFIYDLLRNSKRPRKVKWAFFIALVPVIGMFVYEHSKRRKWM